ncbi:MAG: hypothetical protein AAGA80_07930, partial [Cyanobacteria bacterium P01_F01_bin.143]
MQKQKEELTMSFLFLPKLKKDQDNEGNDVKPGSPGEWEVRSSKTFLTVANSLDIEEVANSLDIEEVEEEPRTVTSIPSIWARALLVETALHNPSYPLRDLIIEQWQGMLAAIALADVRQFDIKVQYVKLKDYTNKDYINKYGSADPFARALYELQPQPTYALYQMDKKSQSQDNNPWQELYTFLWNPPHSEVNSSKNPDTGYRVVGISSPSTFICPAEGSKWTGLKWYEEKGRLSCPNKHLNREEKNWLGYWLEEVIQKLPHYSSTGSAEINFRNSRDNIIKNLKQFRDSLTVSTFGQKLQLIKKENYFGNQIKGNALELLKFPIKAQPQASNIKVIPSDQKEEETPYLLLIDPNINEQWNKEKQEVWIYDNKTFATVNLLRDLEEGKFSWKDQENKEIEWIYAKDLLLKEFHFINLEHALVNNLNPKGTEQLNYKGHQIT